MSSHVSVSTGTLVVGSAARRRSDFGVNVTLSHILPTLIALNPAHLLVSVNDCSNYIFRLLMSLPTTS
jgi:hypothetical protein